MGTCHGQCPIENCDMGGWSATPVSNPSFWRVLFFFFSQIQYFTIGPIGGRLTFVRKKQEVGAVMFLEVESNDRFATGMLRSIQSRLKRPPIPKGASFGFRSPEGLSVFSAIGWSVCTYYVCTEYTVYCLMVEKEHHLLHQHLEHHCHCLSSCLREESDRSPWDRSWVTRTEELLTIHNHLW